MARFYIMVSVRCSTTAPKFPLQNENEPTNDQGTNCPLRPRFQESRCYINETGCPSASPRLPESDTLDPKAPATLTYSPLSSVPVSEVASPISRIRPLQQETPEK